MGTSRIPTKFNLNNDGDEALRVDPLPRRRIITGTIHVGWNIVAETEFRVNPGPPDDCRHAIGQRGSKAGQECMKLPDSQI